MASITNGQAEAEADFHQLDAAADVDSYTQSEDSLESDAATSIDLKPSRGSAKNGAREHIKPLTLNLRTDRVQQSGDSGDITVSFAQLYWVYNL